MKGQNSLALLTAFGVLFIIVGGLLLAYTITSPNTLSVGFIAIGIMMIGIASKFG